MQVKKVALSETNSFSQFFLDYIAQQESLIPFYNRFPSLENFKAQIEEKEQTFPRTQRVLLKEVLIDQYRDIALPDALQKNIDLLSQPTTFTITTGHQLNLFTGPLYFIYKVVTVINACRVLKQAYPHYDFVPVYWMASEDHDYEEIKSFRLYGKNYSWNTSQHGAVGRFSLRDIGELLREVPGEISVFTQAYQKSKTLAEAVRKYMSDLFGKEGLITIEPDDKRLKQSLIGVMQRDILEEALYPLVRETTTDLEKLGYKTQVHCREINFFLLGEQSRNRIESEDGSFRVVDTDVLIPKAEMAQMILDHPERFSPNVIVRPLYQELILPNLAYVGGPAEMIYWLQLMKIFTLFDVPFPVLLPRNFALIVTPPQIRKLKKVNLDWNDFFADKELIYTKWVKKFANNDLALTDDEKKIEALFAEIIDKASRIDPTLEPSAKAVRQKTLKGIAKIAEKMVRAEKRKHQEKRAQIEALKSELFPNNSLQERVDNFLNFYQQDNAFIQKLLDNFDPFDFRFTILKMGDHEEAGPQEDIS